MHKHYAESVEEAVNLALQFKNEGRYDWFRGQLQASWKPASSFERAINKGESKELLSQRLQRFLGWANTEPSLSYLANPENCDQLFAVLQHYGFPTCYMDFSTEPGIAGFFASDCKEPPAPGTSSVIFCLNTNDLRDFYDESVIPYCKDGAERFEIDLISVNVDNLWRLQAQSGHFLFSNHNVYNIYDFDRIEFPWSGYPSFPPKSRIYPEHRSALEQLLENYFEDERRWLNYQKYEKEQRERELSGQSPLFMNLIIRANECGEDQFDAPFEELSSWSEDTLQPWLNVPVENFYEVVGVRQLITLREGLNVPSPCNQLAYGMSMAMRSDTSLRLRAVQWDLRGLPEAVDRDRLEELVREAWNGMRRLPYTDEDIAIACSSLLELCAQPGCLSSDSRKILLAFSAWHSDVMEVEFGSKGDSGSRGYCSKESLVQSINNEWAQNCILSASGSRVDPVAALKYCYLPRKMLDFSTFTKIFGRELIPSQLIRNRKLIHFNPAKIDIFGLP